MGQCRSVRMGLDQRCIDRAAGGSMIMRIQGPQHVGPGKRRFRREIDYAAGGLAFFSTLSSTRTARSTSGSVRI
jgi:hypothetical protein